MTGEHEEHILEARLDDAQVIGGLTTSDEGRGHVGEQRPRAFDDDAGPRRVTPLAPCTPFSHSTSSRSQLKTTCSSGSYRTTRPRGESSAMILPLSTTATRSQRRSASSM